MVAPNTMYQKGRDCLFNDDRNIRRCSSWKCKSKEAIFGIWMQWDESPPSLSCALRSSDAASTRAAAVRADGEGGKREGGAVLLSLARALPSPAHARLRVILQTTPTPLSDCENTSANWARLFSLISKTWEKVGCALFIVVNIRRNGVVYACGIKLLYYFQRLKKVCFRIRNTEFTQVGFYMASVF